MTIWYGDADTLHRSIELADGLNMDQATLRAHVNRRAGEHFVIVNDEGEVLASYDPNEE